MYPQFLQFTLALGRSRDQRTIPIIQNPEEFIRNRIRARIKGDSLRPEEQLVLGTHLFIPFVFPGVLRVQLRVGHLNTSGMKTLACTALTNKDGWIDSDVEEMTMRETPVGIFGEIGSALEFSRFFTDVSRESLGKTPSTSSHLNHTFEGDQEIFLAQDPSVQGKILGDFRKHFDPSTKNEVTTKEAESLFSRGYLREPPEEYVERMARHQSYRSLIFEALPSF